MVRNRGLVCALCGLVLIGVTPLLAQTSDYSQQSSRDTEYSASQWQPSMRGQEYTTDAQQQQQRRTQFGQSQYGQFGQSRFTSGGQKQVSGDIERLYYVNLDNEQHICAKIKTDQGQTLVCYLGPEEQISNLDLNVGDQVTLRGAQNFLQANWIEANNKVARVDHESIGGGQFAQSSQQQMGGGQQQSVRGQISSLRSVRVGQRSHLLADVQTDQGQIRTVDLGPAQSLSQLDLNEGDQIAARGSVKSFRGERVLKAQQIRANGQMVSMMDTESMQDGQSQRFSGTGGSQNQCSGEILRITHVSFDGMDQDHMVAMVRCSDTGETLKVDLGPANEFHQKADLSIGDYVQVRGQPGRIDGQTAILAKQVRANNRMVSIDQPSQRERYQQQSGTQSRY